MLRSDDILLYQLITFDWNFNSACMKNIPMVNITNQCFKFATWV